MAEIWDLLDGEGKKTGKQHSKGEPFPEGLYHLGVDVWMVNAQDKILIQKRSSTKKLSPNVWAMTGGSNIVGETSLETIQREAKEELNVDLDMPNLVLGTKFKTGIVWIEAYFIRQEVDFEKVVLQEEEVSDVKWASLKEIDELVENGEFIEHRWEFVREKLCQFMEETK